MHFKDAYRRGGVAWDDDLGELPDHLCAVLQFGATVDPDIARSLLLEHRAGVEMLRLALTGAQRRRRRVAVGRGAGGPVRHPADARRDARPTPYAVSSSRARRRKRSASRATPPTPPWRPGPALISSATTIP